MCGCGRRRSTLQSLEEAPSAIFPLRAHERIPRDTCQQSGLGDLHQPPEMAVARRFRSPTLSLHLRQRPPPQEILHDHMRVSFCRVDAYHGIQFQIIMPAAGDGVGRESRSRGRTDPAHSRCIPTRTRKRCVGTASLPSRVHAGSSAVFGMRLPSPTVRQEEAQMSTRHRGRRTVPGGSRR